MKRVVYKGEIAYHRHRQNWTRLGHRDDPQTWEVYRALESAIESSGQTVADVASEWFADWLGKYDRSERTRLEYLRQLKPTGKLMQVFGNMSIEEVTAPDLYRYLQRHQAPIQANRDVTLLGQILKYAIRMGYRTAANPATGMEMNPKGGKRDYLTDEQFQRIYKAAPESVQIAMSLSYLTGLRVSDVLALRAENARDGLLHAREGKTRQRVRFEITPALRTVIARCKLDVGPIVHTRNPVRHYTTDGFQKLWQRARLAAGLPGVHFHDIRRKHATDRDEAGLSAQVALGHTDESMTRKYINHPLGRIVRPLK